MTLDDAIATLYAREINCGCETFWDGGIKVWIGDIMNAHHSETMFSRDNMGKAGQWLVARRREFSLRRFSSSRSGVDLVPTSWRAARLPSRSDKTIPGDFPWPIRAGP